MITLGIDLAAEPKNTGGCLIEWRGGGAEVSWLAVDLDDAALIGRAEGAGAIGIDSPFGWPTAFVEAVTAHHAGRPWPIPLWERANRRKLRLRETDEYVRERTGITPLSVSSDTIAIPATRCAGLLDRLGVRDRSGDGRVFEVYPAASLFRWGLPHRRYKGPENVDSRRRLLAKLQKAAPWLELAEADRRLCLDCDHAFDALVASLAARAAAIGLTAKPPPEIARAARAEGWIALPDEGSLAELAAVDAGRRRRR